MEKYKIQKSIGSGAFANVSKAINTLTNEVVAIKKMKKKFSSWDECLNLREIKALTKLSHPNLMKLKEVIRLNDELYCVFEYLDKNIYQLYLSFKENNQYLSETDIKSILFQTANGLAFMHKHGFFHRDLKPENILYSKGVVKLADFGLAREIRSRPPFTDYVSTRWYRAPEILLKSTNYNSPVDIFALGCILAELFMLAPLFSGNSELDQLYKICSLLGTPTQVSWPEGYRLSTQNGINFPHCQSVFLGNIIPNASPEAIQLINQMLSFDPAKRPTASQILTHPFLVGNNNLNCIIKPNVKKRNKSSDRTNFEEIEEGKNDNLKNDENIEFISAVKTDNKKKGYEEVKTNSQNKIPENIKKAPFVIKQEDNYIGSKNFDEEISVNKSNNNDEEEFDELILENKPKNKNVLGQNNRKGNRNTSLENKNIRDKKKENEILKNEENYGNNYYFPKLKNYGNDDIFNNSKNYDNIKNNKEKLNVFNDKITRFPNLNAINNNAQQLNRPSNNKYSNNLPLFNPRMNNFSPSKDDQAFIGRYKMN